MGSPVKKTFSSRLQVLLYQRDIEEYGVPRAIWNEAVLIDSDDTITIEGDIYFPLESVNSGFLKKSSSTSICPRKGKAFFYDVVVDDTVNRDAAWYYLDPGKDFDQLKNRIAFWKGVELRQ